MDASGIIVETVKMAEDGEDVVVRMYESTGSRTRAGIVVSSLFKGISAVDLMEEGDNPLALRDGRAELVFGPFEIHTLRLKR